MKKSVSDRHFKPQSPGIRFTRYRKIFELSWTYLALRPLTSSFHSVAALDHIGLEAYRSRSSVELQEQAAGVAEHGAEFVPTP
jgi:hypothetical protein